MPHKAGSILWGCAGVGLLLLLLYYSLTATGAAASPLQQSVEPLPKHTLLFTIPYGDRPENILMSFNSLWFLDEEENENEENIGDEFIEDAGHSDFRVSWDGKYFYFLEPNNWGEAQVYALEGQLGGLIKVFDRSGRLVRTIGCPTELMRGGMSISPDGKIYLLGDQGGAITVLTPQGTLDADLTERFRRQLRRLQPEDGPSRLLPEYHTVDRFGNLYVKHYRSPEGDKYLVRFNVNGDEPTLLPMGTEALPARNGKIVSLTPESTENVEVRVYYHTGVVGRRQHPRFGAHRVRVYGSSGAFEREFSLPAGNLNQLERNLVRELWEKEFAIIDARGHIFLPLHPTQLRLDVYEKPEEFPEGEGHWSVAAHRDWYQIVEYDSSGNFVGLRASFGKSAWWSTNGRPLPMNVWDVDRNGNVYYIEFYPSWVGLRVMMVPPAPVVRR